MSVLTLCPTRGRGKKAVAEVLRSFLTTSKDPGSAIVFIVDPDDKIKYDSKDYGLNAPDLFWTAPEGLEPGIVAATNAYIDEEWTGDFDVIGFIGDDVRFRTDGWDLRISEEARKGPGIIYGDDGVHGADLPTHWWVTEDIIEAVGYLCNPQLRHFFLDNTWLEIGKVTNTLRYMPDVHFEHLHFSFGKSKKDATYDRTMRIGAGDAERFRNYITSQHFKADVSKVEDVVSDYGRRYSDVHADDGETTQG